MAHSSSKEIRVFPDPILRKQCKKIIRFDATLRRIVEKLEVCLKHQHHGIGIAANQMGMLWQVAIVDVSSRISSASKLILLNPRILDQSVEVASREGCMSVPDYTGNLKRYDVVTVEWQDIDGSMRRGLFEGIEARCIQHEIDHLHGKLFFDRISFLKRDMIPRAKGKSFT